ncbi:hypothetical protein JJJ17_10460 [Paracoccus caeni]|uniref:Uncharacterized protein n=1 Tax=Paracoccus caeni TaxID=657651 RepID=A0A934VUZ2_9RHOB|nr:hypothetical protein [Paracoccus caeni]MBK4216346.1 hypothetical protein [Paracoccus caeni]
MSNFPKLDTRAKLIFLAVGLGFGGIVAALMQIPVVGIALIVLVAILILGLWFDVSILADVAAVILLGLWRLIAAIGHSIAGHDRRKELPMSGRVSFGIGFFAGLALVLWIFRYFSGNAA